MTTFFTPCFHLSTRHFYRAHIAISTTFVKKLISICDIPILICPSPKLITLESSSTSFLSVTKAYHPFFCQVTPSLPTTFPYQPLSPTSSRTRVIEIGFGFSSMSNGEPLQALEDMDNLSGITFLKQCILLGNNGGWIEVVGSLT